jgi:hypothetical protein
MKKPTLAVTRQAICDALSMSMASVNIFWSVADTDKIPVRRYQPVKGAPIIHVYSYEMVAKFLSRVCARRFNAEILRAASFEVRAA